MLILSLFKSDVRLSEPHRFNQIRPLIVVPYSVIRVNFLLIFAVR